MKQERISELMDGELYGLHAELIVRHLGDADARATWATYHAIGDILRGDVDCNVAQRVAARLAAEPTVLAPRPIASAQARGLGMSIAASVAAVSVVGYLALTTSADGARYDTLQQAERTSAGQSPMDDYLALHHGEVRNVAYEPAHRVESPR